MRALDGLDLTVRRRRGARLPRARTVRASRPPSAFCWAWSAPTAARCGCSAATRGRDAVNLHRQIAYVPGDVTLWPSLTGGETIDLLARMRGGIDEERRAELIERFDLDPHQEGPHLLEGQPAEGLAGLGVLVERPAAAARRTEQRPGPVDGERLSAMRRRGPRPRRHRAAVQPHPRRDRGAVRPGHHHPRGPDRRERHAGLDAPPVAHLDQGRNDRRTQAISPGYAASRTSASTATPCTRRSTARASVRSSRCSATPACAACQPAAHAGGPVPAALRHPSPREPEQVNA